MKKLKIDINCDMGESFGAWVSGNDLAVMDYVTSVNIACGFHAGDPEVMAATVSAAAQKGLKLGAHPGFNDLQGFGRREMNLTPREVYHACLYQIGSLQAFALASGTRLHHVKPHGALYNMAAARKDLATAIAEAIHSFDPGLMVYGLSGSLLISEASRLGLKTASEVFSDRSYQSDGSLTPRSHAGALLFDIDAIEARVLKMATEQKVIATDGSEISIKADTICIHGDGKEALAIAQRLWHILSA